MRGTTTRAELASITADFELRAFRRQGLKEAMCAALDEAGKWEQRRCPLNALIVFYFVLMMALRRDLGIPGVLAAMVNLLRDRKGCVDLPLRPVSNEAPMKARKRLGEAPVRVLFERLAAKVKAPATFFGLRAYGVDGVSLTMPDTKANDAAFGRPGASRGKAAFPQAKMTMLVCSESHEVRGEVMGRCNASEREGTAQLLAHLGRGDILMMDRGISSTWLFLRCLEHDVAFLARISASWKPAYEKRLGRGDWLVIISQRVKIPEAERLSGSPATQVVSLKCRLIEARTRTGEKIRLVTSLLDHRCYPAHELVLGYHVRWENELTYDEVKIHFLTVKHGTLKTIFRSKSPDGVRQEAAAMLVVYNLVRGLMREAGQRKNLAPLELSFVDSLEAVRQSIARFELASNARTTFLAQRLLDDIAECVIDRPRRPRRNPRKVKQKMSNFKLKREGDHGETYDPSSELQLTDFRPELRAQ